MSLLKTALALRQSGEVSAAAKLLEQYLLEQPDHAYARYLLAWCYGLQGKEGKAVPPYEAALRGELSVSKRQTCYLGLGSSLRALGRYKEAEGGCSKG